MIRVFTAFTAVGALVLGLAVSLTPALARDQYVVDDAHLFSASAVEATNQKLADFNARTHKEIFVYTTPSLNGVSAPNAAERVFAQQQVNGVMIFIAKSPKTIGVVPDRASRGFFPAGSEKAIRDAIAASFNSGNFDAGLENGVALTENMYLSHLPRTSYSNTLPATVPRARVSSGGFSMGWIFLVLIVIVGFLVLRALFRAIFAPRVVGPYGPAAGPPVGGPGYGPGPGYGGPGYGYGSGFGGGGSFWSGLLGGLGGAWLGNEMFGQHNMGGNIGSAGYMPGGDTGAGNPQDMSGFQSDAGQADMGNASFGDFGGGGGDSGGWGGGDAGGGLGGGDMGGGGW